MRAKFLSLAVMLSTLVAPIVPATAATDGSLIKSASNAAVYYLSSGKRYAFPNEKVFFSWYNGFSGVETVSEGELAS